MWRENEPKEEGERGRSFDWSSGLMQEKELERAPDAGIPLMFSYKHLICKFFIYKNPYNDIYIQEHLIVSARVGQF